MLPDGIRAVALDAFGTLVEIGDKRRPYARLLGLASEDVRQRLRERVMREPLTIEQCLREAGDMIGEADAASLRADLAAELASIRLRPRTNELWDSLRGQGVPIAVCSNLAAPYGPPMLELLPDAPDVAVLSYKVGYEKPEPAIYALVAERLGLPPEAILFSGDTPEADVEGPRAAGMQAVLVGDLEARLTASAVWTDN